MAPLTSFVPRNGRPLRWVVTFLAVALTAWNSRELVSALDRRTTTPRQYVEEWEAYAEGRVYLDSPGGPTVIIFTDYRCGACATLFRSLDRRSRWSEARPHVLVRNLPLLAGSSAAAAAAECAAEQGRFVPMARELYRRHDLDHDALRYAELADEAGVPDLARFGDCLADSTAQARVARDLEVASKLGLYGTPAILVQRELYIGVPTGLQRIVRRVAARPERIGPSTD